MIEQNFTQFAIGKGLPSDYDITDHAALSPSGHMSNRAYDANVKALEQRLIDNTRAHDMYRQAILSGEVVDPSGEVTKAKLQSAQKNYDDKELASKKQIIQSHIDFIESLGKMSHLASGKLKLNYQRQVDDYRAELAALNGGLVVDADDDEQRSRKPMYNVSTRSKSSHRKSTTAGLGGVR